MWLKWMAAPRLELGMRIITQSVYLPRPSVRQAIHLRSALYRIGIAAQDRFPSFSRPASFAAFGPPVSPSVRPSASVRSP